MIFDPANTVRKLGRFSFTGHIKAEGAACLCGEIFGTFWRNFSLGKSTLCVTETDGFVFRVGNVREIPREGCACTVNVTPEGVCVAAGSEQELIRGFMTLLDRIYAVEDGEEL